MATLLERIEADYKTAMKARERLRIDTLRLVKAGMQRMALDKRKDALDEKEIVQVISQQAKLRRETIESAKQAGREDVLKQATEELALLTAYLPEPLSEADLTKLVEEGVAEAGPNQGAIMKYIMGKAGGGVDGKTVSQLVSARLKQK